MYKFEISADTPAELKDMQVQFAREILRQAEQSEPSISVTNGMTDETKIIPISSIPSFPPPVLPTIAPAVAARPVEVHILPTPESVAAVTGTVQVDSRGLPWDARIHATTKTFIKGGAWKNKRGVTDAEIATVENELIGKIKSGAIAQAPPPPPVQAAPIPPPPPTAPGAPAASLPTFQEPPAGYSRNIMTGELVPHTPETVRSLAAIDAHIAKMPDPAPVVAAAPAYENIPIPTGARPAHSINTFKNNLNMVLAQLVEEGKIDQPWILATAKHFQIKDIWSVVSDANKVQELFNTFVHYGFITKVD